MLLAAPLSCSLVMAAQLFHIHIMDHQCWLWRVSALEIDKTSELSQVIKVIGSTAIFKLLNWKCVLFLDLLHVLEANMKLALLSK